MVQSQDHRNAVELFRVANDDHRHDVVKDAAGSVGLAHRDQRVAHDRSGRVDGARRLPRVGDVALTRAAAGIVASSDAAASCQSAGEQHYR